jgi:hypothetical protein
MAKIKEIIEMAPASFKISLLDVLMAMDMSKTKKYVPLMLRVIQNVEDEKSSYRVEEDFNAEVRDYYGVSNLPETIDPKVAYVLLQVIGSDTTRDLMNFMDSFEKGYFKGVDITTIKTKKELCQLNGLTALNKIGKELAKQVQKDYEDEEWLIVRPFTYESSVRYGYGSKWCTSMEKSAEHFFRYSNNGTLIYCLNKKTGDKVAAFSEVGEGLSFWNAEDFRIDSMFSGLPIHIIDVIRGIVTDNPLPNRSLSPEVWQNSKDLWSESWNKEREREVMEESQMLNHEEPVLANAVDEVDFNPEYDGSWVFLNGARIPVTEGN